MKIRDFVFISLMAQGTTSALAAEVGLELSSANVAVGESFSLILKGMGFPATAGGTVGLEWDPSIISYLGFQVSSSWDDAFVFSGNSMDIEDINASGRITALTSITYNDAGVSGDFEIGTLAFAGKTNGARSITLLTRNPDGTYIYGGWLKAGDASENPIPIPISPESASVNVSVGSSVPIPSSIWMMGSFLLGMLGIRTCKT